MSLYGLDESNHQVTILGQDFGIFKATQGVGFVDATCDLKYQAFKAAGKLLGVYHYADFGDPIAEADFFINNVAGYLGEALLVLDVETSTDAAWSKQFMDHVYSRTGVRCLIYGSASNMKNPAWSIVSADYALWAAGYPARFDVPNPPTPLASGADMPYDTGSWPFATIWQYSSSSGTLDRDIAYMTPEAWHKFAQGDRDVQTPPPPVAPTPSVENTTTTTTVEPPTVSTTTTQRPQETATTTTTTTLAPTPKPVIIIKNSLQETVTLAEAVVSRALKTFVQTFLAIFLPTVTGLTTSILNVHSLSDAKALIISAILAAVAAALSAAQNTIKPPKEVTK